MVYFILSLCLKFIIIVLILSWLSSSTYYPFRNAAGCKEFGRLIFPSLSYLSSSYTSFKLTIELLYIFFMYSSINNFQMLTTNPFHDKMCVLGFPSSWVKYKSFKQIHMMIKRQNGFDQSFNDSDVFILKICSCRRTEYPP